MGSNFTCDRWAHSTCTFIKYIYLLVNRLDHFIHTHINLGLTSETVRGEPIGKAVRDLMRLSSGLEYLKYVLCVHEREY